MKRIIFISAVLITIFSLQVTGQKTKDISNDSLFILKVEKPSFKICFPGQFVLDESSETNGLKTELYKAMIGEEVFMLKYTEHKNPAVSSSNPYYMEASLESFVTGIQGTLSEKKNFKYGKYTGLEAYLNLDNKNMNVFYRVLIIDRVQYQLIVITKSEEKTKIINDFFDSFVCPVKD